MKKIILLRHGQSVWNVQNRFTGWTDVPLSPQGRKQARRAGRLLKKHGLLPELAFTSYLTRAIDTLNLALDAMQRPWIPVEKSWHLNERHYGALQGLNKSQTAAQYGEQQVLLWRRSYEIAPPALPADDPRTPYLDPRYRDVPRAALPLTESLHNCLQRLLPYWHNAIIAQLQTTHTILITAHGNSLRCIVKLLKKLSAEEIVSVNIPTAVPYVFELNKYLEVEKDYFLENSTEIASRTAQAAACIGGPTNTK